MQSLYERLGGEPAVTAAVDVFYKRVLADERINHYFANVDMATQAAKQRAFMTLAFGGPQAYKGKDMRTAHQHLHLTEDDFAAVAEHLQGTLESLNVPADLIGEVMTLVGSTKDEVLNR